MWIDYDRLDDGNDHMQDYKDKKVRACKKRINKWNRWLLNEDMDYDEADKIIEKIDRANIWLNNN